MAYIKLHGVSFGYAPDYTILKNIHLTLSAGIWAIAGPNGAGKTTLLKLVSGDLLPTAGKVELSTASACAWLPQLADESAEANQRLSSGEAKMQSLRCVLQQSAQILLLDEPETHLDGTNRRWLKRHIAMTANLALIVSHDADLLNMATRILHVERQSVRIFDSGYAEYRELLKREERNVAAAAARAGRIAKFEQSHLQQTLERQHRRSLNAARRAPTAGIPRIAIGLMKRNAEKTLGKLEAHARQRMHDLGTKIAEARMQVSQKKELHFAFADARPLRTQVRLEVANLQIIASRELPLWRQDLNFSASTGDRIRLVGKNGAGKSLLMQQLCGSRMFASSGRVMLSAHEKLLLDSTAWRRENQGNIFALAQSKWPTLSEGELRRTLGGFGYRGNRVFEPAANLSAGELMRLHVLLTTGEGSRPGFCFFDEAEIGLDAQTRTAAANFLRRFNGIVVFASHDENFAAQVVPTQEIRLRRA